MVAEGIFTKIGLGDLGFNKTEPLDKKGPILWHQSSYSQRIAVGVSETSPKRNAR